MPELRVAGETLQYEIRRSQRARRLRLVVRDIGIEAVAPKRLAERDIRAFVAQHSAWLLRQSQKRDLRLAAAKESRWPLTNGSAITHAGKEIQLRLNHGDLTQFGTGHCDLVVTDPAVYESVRDQLIAAWKIELAKRVVTLAEPHVSALAVKPLGYQVKNARRQWGSCGRHGMIHLNWRLAIVAESILEYVLVHELCHLHERNHGTRFWALVESQLPDYRDRQRALRAQEVWLNNVL